MSNSIPDVILRLARRHLPVDATVPDEPPPQRELPGLTAAPLTPLQREPATGLAESPPVAAGDCAPSESGWYDHDLPVPSPTLQAASVDQQNSPSAAIEPGQSGDVQNPEIQSPHGVSSVADGWWSYSSGTTRAPRQSTIPRVESQRTAAAAAFPGFEPPGTTNRFPQSGYGQRGSEHFDIFDPAIQFQPDRPSTVHDQSDDSFEPVDHHATPTSTGSHNQSPVDAVGESSRQLEESARDLETSLTRLFTTQIETLNRLRDKIAEHERRWVEQQSARRATL